MSDQNREGGPHPEELLDLARDGRLGDAQRQALRQHLEVCFPCATQMRLSVPPPEGKPRALQTHRDRVVVHRALQQTAPSRARSRSRSHRLARRRGFPLVAAAALLLSGTALAAVSWWKVYRHPDVPAGQGVSSASRPVVSGARATPARWPESDVGDDRSAAAEVAAPTAQPPRAVGRARGPAVAASLSAGELFARARTLRLEGNTTGALALYARLQNAHPGSRESRLSHLVVGGLWLQRNNPEQASRHFSAFLAGGGEGAEEGLVGRATAYARLGRAREEAADWGALLAKYPTSVYASRGRARLATLAARLDSGAPAKAGVR